MKNGDGVGRFFKCISEDAVSNIGTKDYTVGKVYEGVYSSHFDVLGVDEETKTDDTLYIIDDTGSCLWTDLEYFEEI